MRSFDFLSATLACVFTAACIYAALRKFKLRLTIRLERSATPAASPADDGGDPPSRA